MLLLPIYREISQNLGNQVAPDNFSSSPPPLALAEPTPVALIACQSSHQSTLWRGQPHPTWLRSPVRGTALPFGAFTATLAKAAACLFIPTGKDFADRLVLMNAFNCHPQHRRHREDLHL